ncbi:MAG: iron-containing alcohol dehydrogenase family protein [Vallitaleaceae bacterium]|nr:iron-containing alcohol dehydrogenase family protein [Vallitaleaceae bacterium]
MNNSWINVPKILETSYDATAKIPSILKVHQFNNIAIFMGIGIYELFGKKIIDGIEQDKSINVLQFEEYEGIEVEKLAAKAYQVPNKVQCILAIGGGKTIDSGKYMAFLNHIPFMSIPTSISNDGFSSSGSSLVLAGKRVSVKSAMPFAIVADLTILRSAPEKFYFSGIGDIVSKVTAGYDWVREENLGITTINQFAAMLAKKSVNSVVRLPFNYIREELFIKEVVDSLIMSGVAMEIAGSSAPASGSEHLISHALDQILVEPCLHGIQVGLATYIMSIVQEHRETRVEVFLTDTGFFEFTKQFGLKKVDFIAAIERAASIKPNRNTYLHDSRSVEKAIDVVNNNAILNSVLK